MSDSTEAANDRIDLAGVARANGDRVGLERVTRPAIPTFDWSDDPQAQHTSSLIKLGALKQAKGYHAEAETLFREALDIGERVLRADDPRLLPALSSVACACISRDAAGEAEPLVARLLTISESNRGQDHPDLVIILNDLTRVCLRHSAHGMAESVLLRLAAIKRSKGEDHPEVATVLASLAVVRQALGRHESAEQLWRRVLAIRERTLAPNHFTLATTLEHLAEACAARGKTGESLQLFRRAQEIRELTLGPDHASVRTSRERIADLQLQGSDDDSLDSQDAGGDVRRGVSPPKGFSLPSALISEIAPREKPAPESAAAKRSRRGTGILERPRSEQPATESEAVVRLAVPHPIREIAHPIAFGVPYADILDKSGPEPEYSEEMDEDVGPVNRFLARSIDLLWRRRTAAVAAIGAAAVFIGVMANDSRAWSETEELAAETIPGPQEPALVLTSPALLPQVSAGPTEEPKPSPGVKALASASVAAPRPRVVERRSSVPSVSDRTTAPSAISIPTMSSTVMTGFDSALRARPDPLRGIGTSDAVELPPVSGDVFRVNPVEREAPAVAIQRPRLIGAVPTPRYPNQLVDVRGEVRVRFDVDTLGRPVMSTLSVVHSPHMLLTAEVLKLISGLRFEPARSGPEGKPVRDAVQLGFQFGPGK
jgi:tetratricopeptide (TPR) repeat protein